MPYANNKFSFATPNPKSRTFSFLKPVQIEDGVFFSKSGSNFQFQDIDSMGLGPLLRLVPSIALAASVIILVTLSSIIATYHEQFNQNELIASIALTIMVTSMIGGCAWLLRDFSESAFLDMKHHMLWIGGGYFGRWQGVQFNEIQALKVVESDKAYTDDHFQLIVVGQEGQHLIYKDSIKEMVVSCAQELSSKLKIPLS